MVCQLVSNVRDGSLTKATVKHTGQARLECGCGVCMEMSRVDKTESVTHFKGTMGTSFRQHRPGNEGETSARCREVYYIRKQHGPKHQGRWESQLLDALCLVPGSIWLGGAYNILIHMYVYIRAWPRKPPFAYQLATYIQILLILSFN